MLVEVQTIRIHNFHVISLTMCSKIRTFLKYLKIIANIKIIAKTGVKDYT